MAMMNGGKAVVGQKKGWRKSLLIVEILKYVVFLLQDLSLAVEAQVDILFGESNESTRLIMQR